MVIANTFGCAHDEAPGTAVGKDLVSPLGGAQPKDVRIRQVGGTFFIRVVFRVAWKRLQREGVKERSTGRRDVKFREDEGDGVVGEGSGTRRGVHSQVSGKRTALGALERRCIKCIPGCGRRSGRVLLSLSPSDGNTAT